jgi:citrate synthase
LALNASFLQVLYLSVTGRDLTPEAEKFLNCCFICTSYPDPRIWCNQIAAFSGDAKTSSVVALTAGLLATDSRLYGPGTLILGMNFIKEVIKLKDEGKSIPEILDFFSKKHGKPYYPGYSRPIALHQQRDERVYIFETLLNTLKVAPGKALSVAYELESYLIQNTISGLNYLGFCAAVWIDFDPLMTDVEFESLYSIATNAGLLSCYKDRYDKPEKSFLAQRCDDINYTGKPIRSCKAI